MSMDVNTSPTNFSRNNLVAGDLALLTTSIWSEAISGRKVDTKELAKSHEQMKKEYIKAIKSTRTKEELEGKRNRVVCSRCGKSGHMAFQCFNFLNKTEETNTDLNALISSDSDSEEQPNRSRSRSRSRQLRSQSEHSERSERSERSQHSHRHHHHHHHHHRSPSISSKDSRRHGH